MKIHAPDLLADETGDPESYPVLYRGAIRPDTGRWFVTDRAVLIYTSELEDPTLIQPAPLLVTAAQLHYVAPALVSSVIHERPEDRLFQSRYLDVLEEAGYRIRPLFGQANMHGIVSEADELVGILNPMRYDYDGCDMTRTAAR